jgi:hypothetical protein
MDIAKIMETSSRIIYDYSFRTTYCTLDGGKTWKSCPEWKPEKLKGNSSIKLEAPN